MCSKVSVFSVALYVCAEVASEWREVEEQTS